MIGFKICALVSAEIVENPENITKTIRWLAGKPSFSVLSCDGYLIDGVRYFIKDRDDARVVQNSGVSLVAWTVQVSSAKDMNPVESDMTFYGIIEEIWELDYYAFKAPLFLCKWADSERGIKVDFRLHSCRFQSAWSQERQVCVY